MYQCEIYTITRPIIKSSYLDNDNEYVTLNNGELSASGITFYRDSGISYEEPLDIIKVYNDISPKISPRIMSDAFNIYFPYNIAICKKRFWPESFNKDDYIHPITILTDYEKSVYKIVNTLPTTGISSRNIYMIKKTNPTDENIKYDKYIYISEDNSWEKIG